MILRKNKCPLILLRIPRTIATIAIRDVENMFNYLCVDEIEFFPQINSLDKNYSGV